MADLTGLIAALEAERMSAADLAAETTHSNRKSFSFSSLAHRRCAETDRVSEYVMPMPAVRL